MKLRIMALLCGVSLAAFAPAFAAETDNIPTVIVTGQANPEDPNVVKSTRTKLSRTPGAVSVVASETYSNSYALGLYDTLKNVSGVFAQKKFGEDTRLSIRGSGIGNASHNRGTWLSVDGVPVNQADGSGDFQEIDPLSARYIEIYKGGNALRFGGSQLGGAINYVTASGQNAGYRTLLRVEGGSFGTRRAQLAYADVIGDYDLYLSTTVTHADGWRANSEQDAKRVTLNVGRTFAEGRSVRLIFQANDIDQRIAGGLTLAQALTTPKATTAANYPTLKYGRNMKSARATVQTDWRLNDDWAFEGGVYAAWKELIHPISIYLDYEYQNYGAFGRFDGKGTIGGLTYDAFFGANYLSGNAEALTFANANGIPGAMSGNSQQNAAAWDVFGEGRMFVTDELALVAGASYGWTDRDYVNRLALTRSAKTEMDWWAPRIGILWQNASGQQVFANLTKSVEAPTYGALVQAQFQQFTPVNPQEAITAEIGTRGRSGALTWDLALYRAEIDGEMLNFIVTADIPAATFNADSTIHQGLEAALDWKVGTVGDWSVALRQTYTWSDFKFDHDKTYGNARLPVVPEHYYRGELSLSTKTGWRIAPSVEWAPKDVWVDYANTQRAPGFTVWNLSASKKVNQGLEVFAEARNLSDTRYVSNVNAVTDFTRVAASAQSVFTPGEGRAVFVGLKLTGK
ncbi:TonB-dependent receptor [Asticcacaulis sp. BYS171W]|uniref:TonB-dependent receptor n=1 Tax=Asticcacaulis aquaticus TaxID=2984212 RepID=A0ABT5HP49_9CAUL|nr:TonB-dependent receptor [Asticcacaulis aquaticus]MDC7681822.1 TonB-dependent receptor [Asticcacaulis aquaticus]